MHVATQLRILLCNALILFHFAFCFSDFVKAQNMKHVPGEVLVKMKPAKTLPNSSVRTISSSGIASLDELNKALGVKQVQSLFRKESLVYFKKRGIDLSSFVKIKFSLKKNINEIISAYQKNTNVEYVQPNYIHQIHMAPDDSLFSEQMALQVIHAEQAWDVQLASAEIIVSVIDTGIDYNHEDLREALWLNSGEDLDSNGRVDSTDFNGFDDDGNGYVDDIRGWDFTDAPSYPDGGDFQNPDNNPFDENGHGTLVAGIIGATGNNRIGIAGLAFGCQIMNLRAGTSLGFLEEDDVAAAVVYAVENGARIINMSFGDEAASPLLQDVMQYAYSQNCILVASSGNSNTDRIHFPSGFAETISVGATNENDILAGFSNYGSSLDVVAPGVNILTTKLGNKYADFSGTSASAPFVSALAALILSKTPELSNESVKGLLSSTTDDLGESGWDHFYASGRINADKAINSPFFSIARILEPAVDEGFAAGPVLIRGTAAGALLEEYILELGAGESPTEWMEILRQKNRQTIDEHFMEMAISTLSDTLYTLRLIVQNKDGTSVEDKVRFFIDRTPPEISNVLRMPMLDGAQHGFLLEFETDDLCDAAIHFRAKASSAEFREKQLRFRTRIHRVNFTQDIFSGQMEFFIKAVNGSGLSSINNNDDLFFEADLSAPPIGSSAFAELNITFPPGLLLAKTSDFDGDGFKEVILNQYNDNFNFGALKVLEFHQNQFEEVFSSQAVFIPRDWGDSDSDGLLEILAGVGSKSYIFEAPAPNEFPSSLVWADSSDAWASRFTDLDQDGQGEIIVRLDRLFTIWETIGDNDYALVDSFPNPTVGSNSVGVPHSEVADFDDDGLLEILFGDYDGDVYVYENRGDNDYEFTWSERLPLIDAIDYLSVGDYDGDGVSEFVAGCHSDPGLNTESTFDSRHWLFRVYKKTADNSFAMVWEQAFFGFQSPADFDAGVSSGDVDNDGRPEILINIFPDFYVIDFDPMFSEYQAVWHNTPNRSNQTVVEDFDNNGLNELYFNTGDKVVGYRVLSNFTGPPTPVAFKARPLDFNLVELSWQYSRPVDGFQVYRGTNNQDLIRLDYLQNPLFLDSTVTADIEYWYGVTAIDSMLLPVESLLTPLVRVTPGAKPFLESAIYVHPNQVQLSFSEQMNHSVTNQTNFEIENVGTPTSSILSRSGKEVIITSPLNLIPGSYKVAANDVSDVDGTPIDTMRNAATFQVATPQKAPYLVSATLEGKNQLRLEFSQSMAAASAAQIENYRIEPNIRVAEARLSTEDSKMVILKIDSSSPIGPYGVEYFVTVSNIASQAGLAIRFGQGDTAALVFSSSDLSNVFAYPNPYRRDSSQEYVTIAGLTREATVRILDVSGRLIRTLQETDGNGGIQWDLKDESENFVPSGIYIFYVVGEGDKATGKLAVVN